MAIERIDSELCNSCGICVDICPMDVIRMDEKSGKAIIRYPEDCTSCSKCDYNCPPEAIYISPQRKTRPLVAW